MTAGDGVVVVEALVEVGLDGNFGRLLQSKVGLAAVVGSTVVVDVVLG